jgi:BASS family bile acid:Na+ symporter
MTLLAVLEAGVPAVAFLLMIAVGLDVSREGLREIPRNAPLVAIATLAQAAWLPAAALLLLRLVPQDPAVAEYVLLVAACPGGGMSNVYVYLARANTALSVTLTAVSCLLAVVTLPAVMWAYGRVAAAGTAFDVPVPTLLAQLLAMAVIPVTLGVYVRHRWPALERRYGGRLRAASAAGVVLIVAIGIAQSASSITATIVAGAVPAAGLVLAGMAGGWILARARAAAPPDAFALVAEFAVRNLAIAMVIEVSLLHHPDFVAFGALALLAQASVLLAAAGIYRRGSRGVS